MMEVPAGRVVIESHILSILHNAADGSAEKPSYTNGTEKHRKKWLNIIRT